MDLNDESIEKDEREEREEDEKDYAIIPPNGGWGWMVVACAFYCSLVVDGIQLTFGVFLRKISESFDSDYSKVALAGSLMFGTHLLVGPLCAGFSTEFGLRPITITGSLICCCGVGLTYFATDYWYMYFTYGIVGGMGLGLVYMNSLIISGLYFTTLMPLAIGIVVCGTGVGTMVFAGMGYFLLTITDWQTSFLIEAGFAASMGLAAIAFKPLKPVKVKLTSPPERSKTFKRKRKKSIYIKKEIVSRGSTASLRTLQNLAWEGYLQEAIVTDMSRKTFCRSNCRNACSRWCARKMRREKSEYLILSEIKSNESGSRRKSYVERKDLEDLNSDTSVSPSSVDASAASSHRVIFEEVAYEKEKRQFCVSIKRTLVTMMNFRLLGSGAFFLFTVSGALQMASLLIVYIYEKDRCASLGFTDEMSVYFVIFLGGSNTLWRLCLGGIATLSKVNYEALAISGIVIGGIATMFSGISDNVYYQFGFCTLFSLGMASFAVFRLIFLLDLIDSKQVENATGINLLFMGVTCIIFPPLFGWIMEATKSYNAIFLITGVILFASGFMLAGLKKVRKEELEKEGNT